MIIVSFGQTDAVHLDAECVLYGEIAFVGFERKPAGRTLSVVEKIPVLNSELFLSGNMLFIALNPSSAWPSSPASRCC